MISIKKEKEDICPTENHIDINSADVSGRIVKTTAKTAIVKGKSNETMSNIKVKTLEEIKLEKKKQKKKLKAPTTKITTNVPIQNGGSNTAVDVKPIISLGNFNLKPLTVCLMPLPNGQYAGKRTFKVHSLNKNVTIKKEPVDDENENSIQQAPQQQTQQQLSPLVQSPTVDSPPTKKLQQEKENMESEYQEETIKSMADTSDGVSDTSSSLDYLSSNVDWSDVPKSTQDEDTMSIFAVDDIFGDEEPEPDHRQSAQAKKQQRNQPGHDDLRNLLKNPSSLANYCNNGLQESTSPTTQDSRKMASDKKWKKQKRIRNQSKDSAEKGQSELTRDRNVEEMNRLKILCDVMKQNTQIKPGVIPMKRPVTPAETSHIDLPNNRDQRVQQHNFAIPVLGNNMNVRMKRNFRRQHSQNAEQFQPGIHRHPFPIRPLMNDMNIPMNMEFTRQNSQRSGPLEHQIPQNLFGMPPVVKNLNIHKQTEFRREQSQKSDVLDQEIPPDIHMTKPLNPFAVPPVMNNTNIHMNRDLRRQHSQKSDVSDQEIPPDTHMTKPLNPFAVPPVMNNTNIHMNRDLRRQHSQKSDVSDQEILPEMHMKKPLNPFAVQQPVMNNTNIHKNRDFVRQHSQRSDLLTQEIPPEELRVRPNVPGGRAFFENVPSHPETIGDIDQHEKQTGQQNLEERRYQEVVRPFKRRSTDDGTDSDGSDPQLAKRPKQIYCTTQIRLGKCHFSFCKLKHMTEEELEEYKKSDQLPGQQCPPRSIEVDEVEPVEQVEPVQQLEPDQIQAQPLQKEPNTSEEDFERMLKGLIGATEQAIERKKLSEAWQLIQHLHEMCPTGNPSLTSLVERIFALCPDDNVDTDIAAQVCSKAFDLLAPLHGEHNQHDFTQLIGCLCKTGQYIRAYEVFGRMKEAGHTPTQEVFLDLINSSSANPDWAFNLLEEIKERDLFGESLCSALITLCCKTKKPPVERVWSLFKEMMKKSLKPSKEVFLAFLDMLADNNQAKKLLKALNLYDDPTVEPPPKCNKVVVNYSKDNAELVLASITSVLANSELSEPQLDTETWNTLLSNCYSKSFNLSTKAQQIEKLMRKFNVPLTTQGYNSMLCSLSDANLTMSVLELYREMVKNGVDISKCKEGLVAAADALTRAKQPDELAKVVRELLDNGIMPEEKSVMMVFQHLGTNKSYEELYSIFKKSEEKNLTFSWICYKKLRMILELWPSNPDAALDVYREMRRAYPTPPDQEQLDESLYKSSKVIKSVSHVPCRFFAFGKCIFGDSCRFAHGVANSSGELNSDSSLTDQSTGAFIMRNSSEQAEAPSLPLPPPPAVPTVPMPFTLAMNPMITPVANTAFVYQDPSYANLQAQAYAAYYNAYGMTATPAVPTTTAVTVQVQDQKPVIPKSEVKTYKKKIEKATEESSCEELAVIYVSMKNDNIPVCNEMLEMFYSSLITFTNIGESLSSFVAIIDIQLDNPDSPELESRESFDTEDHKFIGELGVALMQFCSSSQRLDEGYLVLHVLHQYSINYFQFPASFVPNQPVLTSSGIALLAADMCLCLEKDPQYDGAVEVLRGCNYALPQDGYLLTAEDAEKRSQTIQKMTNYYLGIKNYEVVKEFLDNVGDCDTFGMTHLKSIYNELLKCYIDDKNVEEAIKTISEMESKLISRDTSVLRSLVICLCSTDRFLQAKEIFKSSCLQGAYPVFPQGEGLWHASLWPSFSKCEIQFYLEQHLQLLNKHVEQYRAASQMPYEESHLRPLRISIVEDETDRTSNVLSLHMIREVQERIIETLGSEFNPPLSCGVSDIIGEVLVNPRSLRRWFLANPGYDVKGSPGSDDSYTQRNVSTSQGSISVRLEVARTTDASQIVSEPALDNKVVTDKIKHTICSHLTRYFRSGVISDRAEFKRHARIIAQDYFRQHNLPTEYSKLERNRVINFVDAHFNQINGDKDL